MDNNRDKDKDKDIEKVETKSVDEGRDKYKDKAYRTTRVKSEKFVTRFGESLNLVKFLVNILVKN